MTAKGRKISNEAGDNVLRGVDILNHALEATLGPEERRVVGVSCSNRPHTFDAIASGAFARAH